MFGNVNIMITLITGSNHIQRKALMSALTLSNPTSATTSYLFFTKEFYDENILDWSYEPNNDLYFLFSQHDESYQNIVQYDKNLVDKHYHIVQGSEWSAVYEFDRITENLADINTLTNAKKYIFNHHHLFVGLQPYLNNQLFRIFKSICFFVYILSIIYAVLATFQYKDVNQIQQVQFYSLFLACVSSGFLMSFTTFRKVAYE